MAKKEQEIKFTIICHNCDRKFSILMSEIKRKQVVYLGEDEERLGLQLVMPKTFNVPCPYCSAENEVKLP